VTITVSTQTRLEKTAVDTGFDVRRGTAGEWLAFASSQAPLEIWLTASAEGHLFAALSQAHVALALDEHSVATEMPLPAGASAARAVADFPSLHRLLRRSFQLSRSLPNELLQVFEKQTAALPRATEVERLAVQRVGQDVFRAGLMEYWDGRCAVTGLAVAELLRASHIKSWSRCETDAERLDVFNGLLLAPNLDAVFDKGLVTVTENGSLQVSPALSSESRRLLGLDQPLRVDGLATGHGEYLAWHRTNLFQRVAAELLDGGR